MAENPQCPSPEEVIDTMQRSAISAWERLVSVLFGSLDGPKNYTGSELRDRMWIMWSLARIAANEQWLDTFDSVVRAKYTKLKEQGGYKWVLRKGPEYPYAHWVVKEDHPNEKPNKQ